MAHFTSTIWSGQSSRPETVVEADDDEPPGRQAGPMVSTDEAAGVVVARDPRAAVDVHRGRRRAVRRSAGSVIRAFSWLQ